MYVYVNARFLTQPITGVQRFAIELSKQLKKKLEDKIIFLAPYGSLDTELAKLLDVQVIGGSNGHKWEQIELPRYLNKLGKPLLVNLCSTAPVIYKNQIATHHDITYIRYPESFSIQFKLLYRILVPLMLKNSKCLITVSEFSKNEIASYFNYPKNKIHVIYNGVNKDNFNAGFINNEKPYTRPYLLAVSSNNYHKNFNRLIDAFNNIYDKNIDLFIIGTKSSKSFSKIGKGNSEPPNENVKFLGRVTDKELIYYYKNALAFIFPSLYEGFGIPPIEAQALGCPVIASTAASIPEVLGNSAIYFDPNSVHEMTDKINLIIENIQLREEMALLGKENARKYNWENSAKLLLDIIENNRK